MPAKLGAADRKKVEKLLQKAEDASWASPEKALPLVREALAVVADKPYGEDALRERAELLLLQQLVAAGQLEEARALWATLIDTWSSTPVHTQSWVDLAKVHRTLGLTVPAELRDRVRLAWAMGRLRNAIFPRPIGDTQPEPPTDPTAAYWQAMTEVRCEQYERAAACLAIARATKPVQVAVAEVVLAHLQHQETGPRFEQLLATGTREPSYELGELLAALSVYLGREEARPAILAAWKSAHAAAETSLYEA